MTTSARASPGWSSGQPVLLGPTILPGPASTAGNGFLPQTPPSPPPNPTAGNALKHNSIWITIKTASKIKVLKYRFHDNQLSH
ncbi:unnamed protein product [Prunus armeniaca]